MAHNYNDSAYGSGANGMGVFSAVLAGALLGAAAMFLSDERNRKKVAKSFDHLKEEGEERINDIEERVNGIKEKGLERVSGELSKAQDKIKREQRKS